MGRISFRLSAALCLTLLCAGPAGAEPRYGIAM